MGRTCTACVHEKRAEIDTALTAGEPYRRVAEHFGLKPSAVDRHKTHIPKTLVLAKHSADVANANGLLSEVTRLRDEAQRLGKKAEKAGDLAVALAAVREQTRIVELLAKIAEVAAKNKPPDGADIDMSGLTDAQLDALAALDSEHAG